MDKSGLCIFVRKKLSSKSFEEQAVQSPLKSMFDSLKFYLLHVCTFLLFSDRINFWDFGGDEIRVELYGQTQVRVFFTIILDLTRSLPRVVRTTHV